MPDTPCPYCGHLPESSDATRCDQCGGLFEPLSRKATQLAMGPWFVRDEDRPFMPGFNEAILRMQVASGKIKADTTVRGPTTQQFWMRADQAPGLSRLLGKCHACNGGVTPEDETCNACHTDLSLPKGIDRLGLAYVDTFDRQQAQAEVEAMRTGKPPLYRKKTPKPAPVAQPVDPTLLEPVAPEPDATEYVEDGAPQASDIAEDLWQSDVPVATRRRTKRSGPDPIVLVLGVLFICVVGIGLLILITSDRPGGDDPLASDPSGSQVPGSSPQRSAKQVQDIGAPVRIALEIQQEEGVPAAFATELTEIETLIKQAERDTNREALNQAHALYEQAQAKLAALPDAIADWQAQQDAKADALQQVQEVAGIRAQAKAQSLNAQQYAPASLADGDMAWDQVDALVESESYIEAEKAISTAEQAYQQAIDAAQAGQAAEQAADELARAKSAGHPEQTLRQHANASIDLLSAKEQEASERFRNRDYADAERAYRDAIAALDQATKAVELARFRKVYAYQAGDHAAAMLLAIAAKDGITPEAHQALTQSFNQLGLARNPATALKPGKDADYAQTADQLVNAARDAIVQAHGEPIRACYHAGFQARIIEQTLTTTQLTDDQKSRIHKTLNTFQDQASAAGWDVTKMRSAIEAVRKANRNARLGEDPQATRAAFALMIKPLEQRDTAARLMDPILSPGSPGDPELFPGLGSSGP